MIGSFPSSTDDFLVALMTDQQDVVVVPGEPPGLVVHLGDQRAGGVNDLQVALAGADVHRRRDPVRGEHHNRSSGTCSVSSTKTAPALARVSTTWRLCTIS